MRILLLLFVMTAILNAQEIKNNARPWKGNAILGNGNICVVYSDDPRIIKESGGRGIQHFYYKNYTADYISSAQLKLNAPLGRMIDNVGPEKTGMISYFAAGTESKIPGNITLKTSCYVMPYDAAVISGDISGKSVGQEFSFTVQLRSPKTVQNSNGTVTAEYSNGTLISIAPKNASSDYTINISGDTLVTFTGKAASHIDFIIAAVDNKAQIEQVLSKARAEKNLYESASKHWDKWFAKGKLPSKYQEEFKRNLYAAKSASLNGEIPADITGQFVTNGMPQLYPRDAMMVARVFMLTGHYEEAKQVIQFWGKPGIPKKTKGEFYARYDAYAQAVDGGSGARYDEPEWDANGYLIKLVHDYYVQKNEMLLPKEFIYELADFLVENIDEAGLLFEGGIIEWRGYLPATNMNCAAGLIDASEIAAVYKDRQRSKKYQEASERLSANMYIMFDIKRNTYADIRFGGTKTEDGTSAGKEITRDTLRLWNTSMLFGILWGYPDHKEVKQSAKFYEGNTTKIGGGLQYFEARDPGLAGYGNDVFFFCTAGAAQYEAKYGNKKKAEDYIKWMINNSNIYGLMPERIYLNESDCSPASPLSWCCAEFAAALMLL